jgi:hypothetical protein
MHHYEKTSEECPSARKHGRLAARRLGHGGACDLFFRERHRCGPFRRVLHLKGDGRGLLADFGYPAAHEDDAEHAVRAGIRLCAAVENLASTRGG